MSKGVTAKGLKLRIGKYNFRLWSGGFEIGNDRGGRCWFFPWNSFYRRKLKYKIMWWIALKLPKQAALYAFVRVHSLSGDGPEYNGEYSKAYKLWVKEHGIEE